MSRTAIKPPALSGARVVIGMDPHKRSVTVEVMAADEVVLGGGRYATDRDGYQAVVAFVKRWPARVWAIEGCNGIGKHVANRLPADGEDVVDVPPKLSARTRRFAGRDPRAEPGWRIRGPGVPLCLGDAPDFCQTRSGQPQRRHAVP